VDTAAARATIRAADGGWQPYERTASILGGYGIRLLDSRTAHSAGQAMAAADELGYPVVLKAADPQLVHKSDVGAVHLGLAGPDEVDAAYHAIGAAVRPTASLASLDRSDATDRPTPAVLVQPMATGTVELVAGIVHDPLFGSLVMTGLGGVHTDLLGDRAFRLMPMTDLDAGRMWRSLRAAPLLAGYRGAPPVDTGALEDLLLRLGRLAEELPEVAELDLNPVLVGPAGLTAVDAKLRLAPAGDEPDAILRRLR
jgi:acyl-CoA synthetase (NDP forming)